PLAYTREVAADIPRRGPDPKKKAPAMTPEHHGTLPAVIDRRCPHIQHEAVLVHRERLRHRENLEQLGRHRKCVVVLKRPRSVNERIANSRPWRGLGGWGNRRAAATGPEERMPLKTLIPVLWV